MRHGHVDIESRSVADLPKVGARYYALHPTTEILCLSWAVGEDPPELWFPGDPAPKAFRLPCRWLAWNAEFEIAMFEYIMIKHGFPPIPDENWQCVQSDALALGLPAKLDQAGGALRPLGITNLKDKEGKNLIDKLCKPKKPTKKSPGIWREKKDFPKDYEKLYEYCKQDVRTERDIYNILPRHATKEGSERDYYLNTVRMNRRGVPVAIEEIKAIQSRIDRYTEELSEELKQITSGEITTANQRDRILRYLENNCGLKLENLQAPTVENILDNKLATGPAKRILEIRHTVGKASVKKYKKMIACICPLDGTIKNNHIYHKASTGRYAGVNTQFQNLSQQRKQVIKNPDYAFKSFIGHSTSMVSFLYGGDLSELAKDLVRSVIKTDDSHIFICADYKGVEARGTAWACYEHNRIEIIKSGLDIYRFTASGMYGIPYEDIPKDSDERQAGKINELLGGYQGGWRAILKGAKKYKIDFGEVKSRQLINKSAYEIFQYCVKSFRYQIWCDCRIRIEERKTAAVNERVERFKQRVEHISDKKLLLEACAVNGLDLARAKVTEDNKAYRSSRPLLTAAWQAFSDTAFEAMNNPGIAFIVPNVRPATFQLRGAFLFLRLPSGRELSYPFPEIRKQKTDWGSIQKVITVRKAKDGKWTRLGMYGGKWFQNYIQALCRDLLFEGQQNTEKAGYPWILSVHDEGLALVPKNQGLSLEHFIELFTKKSTWAKDFPLEANGWTGPRYHK